MNQPYIDCALRLANKGFAAEDVADVLCETAEGYVHRLWEPLASKHRPANEYAAKFSTPFNIAVAFVTGGAGLEAFSRRDGARSAHPRARVEGALRGRSGQSRIRRPTPVTCSMTLKDGRVFEERQPHIRGGAQRTALARGDRAQVPRQRALRRLGRGARRAFLALRPGRVQRAVPAIGMARLERRLAPAARHFTSRGRVSGTGSLRRPGRHRWSLLRQGRRSCARA